MFFFQEDLKKKIIIKVVNVPIPLNDPYNISSGDNVAEAPFL